MDREGFIVIISPVRDLIFIEKIAACYISSVGAGLAPAPLWACPSPSLGLPQPLLGLPQPLWACHSPSWACHSPSPGLATAPLWACHSPPSGLATAPPSLGIYFLLWQRWAGASPAPTVFIFHPYWRIKYNDNHFAQPLLFLFFILIGVSNITTIISPSPYYFYFSSLLAYQV